MFYLKMKIKSIRRPKKTATLSIVLSMTMSCRLRFGRKRTSFRIRSRRNVLRTDRPDPSLLIPSASAVYISNPLKEGKKVFLYKTASVFVTTLIYKIYPTLI